MQNGNGQVLATQAPLPSVIESMAARFGMERRAFEATLKATVVPANVSNEQFAAFLLVAKQYNLNPITKEIYAFPARNGGIQPIVGIDGWANIINSHPMMDGMEFEDHFNEGKLTGVTCRIYRKDRAHAVACTEYMDECKGATDTWKRWPARMLRHKALIQCARYAFGFSGIVDPDEAERQIEDAPIMEGTPTGPTTGKATARQVYGSARAMKDKHKEIAAEINSAATLAEVDAVETKHAADYEAMGSIDAQLSADLRGISERRKRAIEASMKTASVPIEDGGLSEAEMEIWEQERATLNGKIGD